jgi:hypothetical protein
MPVVSAWHSKIDDVQKSASAVCDHELRRS